MDTIKLTIQPLVLTVEGAMPTIPSPSTAVPGDGDFDSTSDLLIGQFCYNTFDDIWYYRGSSVGIQEAIMTGISGVTEFSALTDVNLSVSLADGAYLQYDGIEEEWIDVSTLDADTLEGDTKQEIIDGINESQERYDIINDITTAPAVSGWYGISRWKSFDCNLAASLITQTVGGLTYDSVRVEGLVDSISTDDWTIQVKSNGAVSFTKARLSQYTISSDNYTYLEVYKDIANTGTFSIVTERNEYNYSVDSANYTFESLEFVDISGYTMIRRSDEIIVESIISNRNNNDILTIEGKAFHNYIQAGEDSPEWFNDEEDITAWDMSTIQTHEVALPAGITYDQILDARIMIFNDGGTESYPLSMDGYWYINSTTGINMVINSNGFFDDTPFSGVGTRGKIFITIAK